MLLHDIAHARSGDKGDTTDLTLIVYKQDHFDRIAALATPDRVRRHFGDLGLGEIRRYDLPHLGALKFVVHGALEGGVTRSLNLDGHGKCLGSLLLAMDLDPDLHVSSDGARRDAAPDFQQRGRPRV